MIYTPTSRHTFVVSNVPVCNSLQFVQAKYFSPLRYVVTQGAYFETLTGLGLGLGPGPEENPDSAKTRTRARTRV